jgi:hypothetical protein
LPLSGVICKQFPYSCHCFLGYETVNVGANVSKVNSISSLIHPPSNLHCHSTVNNTDLHRKEISHLAVCHTLWLCNFPYRNMHARITDFFFQEVYRHRADTMLTLYPRQGSTKLLSKTCRVPLLCKRISPPLVYFMWGTASEKNHTYPFLINYSSSFKLLTILIYNNRDQSKYRVSAQSP